MNITIKAKTTTELHLTLAALEFLEKRCHYGVDCKATDCNHCSHCSMCHQSTTLLFEIRSAIADREQARR